MLAVITKNPNKILLSRFAEISKQKIKVIDTPDKELPQTAPDYIIVLDDVFNSEDILIGLLSQAKHTIVANMHDKAIAEAVKSVMKQTNLTVLDYNNSEFGMTFKPEIEKAAKALLQLSICLGLNLQIVKDLIVTLSGGEYRLQLIQKLGKTKIYNDSASTTPESTIHTLEVLPNSILICGGERVEGDYPALAESIDRHARVVYFLDGSATEEIQEFMKDKKKMRSTYFDLEILIQDLKKDVRDGDLILFSPATKITEPFEDEIERGQKFTELIQKYFPTN